MDPLQASRRLAMSAEHSTSTQLACCTKWDRLELLIRHAATVGLTTLSQILSCSGYLRNLLPHEVGPSHGVRKACRYHSDCYGYIPPKGIEKEHNVQRQAMLIPIARETMPGRILLILRPLIQYATTTTAVVYTSCSKVVQTLTSRLTFQ